MIVKQHSENFTNILATKNSENLFISSQLIRDCSEDILKSLDFFSENSSENFNCIFSRFICI